MGVVSVFMMAKDCITLLTTKKSFALTAHDFLIYGILIMIIMRIIGTYTNNKENIRNSSR